MRGSLAGLAESSPGIAGDIRREAWRGWTGSSDGESDVEDVALTDLVVLALDPDLALLLGGIHRAGRDQLVVRDHLGPDEPAFEIGVDHARGLGRLRTAADLPCAGLVVPGRQERDQVDSSVARSDHGLEPWFVHPELVQERPGLRGIHLRRLGLDRGIDPD